MHRSRLAERRERSRPRSAGAKAQQLTPSFLREQSQNRSPFRYRFLASADETSVNNFVATTYQK
jgi:hypothetical protein